MVTGRAKFDARIFQNNLSYVVSVFIGYLEPSDKKRIYNWHNQITKFQITGYNVKPNHLPMPPAVLYRVKSKATCEAIR